MLQYCPEKGHLRLLVENGETKCGNSLGTGNSKIISGALLEPVTLPFILCASPVGFLFLPSP